MNYVMFSLMAIAWIFGLILLVRLFRSERSIFEKFAGGVLLLVPVFGPFLYQFVIEPPPPQNPRLRANGARGDYTQRWIVLKPVLERGLKGRESSKDNADGAVTGCESKDS